jgi:hypothetical protein
LTLWREIVTPVEGERYWEIFHAHRSFGVCDLDSRTSSRMADLQRRASQAESVPSLAADASELAVPFPKAEDEEEYEDEHQFVSHQALSS